MQRWRAEREQGWPDDRAELEALVEKVIGAAYEVSNVLGAGFLEKLYETALIEELGLRGIRAKPQVLFRLPTKANTSAPTWPTWWWKVVSSWR